MDFSGCSSILKFLVSTKFELQNENCVYLLIFTIQSSPINLQIVVQRQIQEVINKLQNAPICSKMNEF